jgi:hypothetical protein
LNGFQCDKKTLRLKKKKTVTNGKPAKKRAQESGVDDVAAADEDGVCLEEDEPSNKSHCLVEDKVLRLVAEVERELSEIEALAKRDVSFSWNVPAEGPPDVGQVIRSATLDNVGCFLEQDEVALHSAEARVRVHVWWRVAKWACLGMFQLLR